MTVVYKLLPQPFRTTEVLFAHRLPDGLSLLGTPLTRINPCNSAIRCRRVKRVCDLAFAAESGRANPFQWSWI
jgi:hypothetical protein